MSRFVRAKKRLWFSSLPLPHALKNGSASTTLRSSSNVRFSSEVPNSGYDSSFQSPFKVANDITCRMESSVPSQNTHNSQPLESNTIPQFVDPLTGFKSISQSCTPLDLHCRYEELLPAHVRFHEISQSSRVERACIDEFSRKNRRFCKLFKVSERAKRVLVPKNRKPKDNSPSAPFYHEPSLGVDQILQAVFRARATFFVGNKREVFSGWVAAPSSSESNAVAFTAGHCYDSHVGFSKVTVCFGSQVGSSDFDSIGLDCAVQPITVCNGDEDLAVFEVFDAVEHVLLPCSAIEECQNDNFIAAFSYPCTHSFMVSAHEELVQGIVSHGISELYSNVGVGDVELYQLLAEVFQEFGDGTLMCSPGNLTSIGTHNCYKCSTLGGSSGAPIVLSRLPGYVVGVHSGGLRHQDHNISTSTDSHAFVSSYSEHVLPKLPPRKSAFWDGWNLGPFLRWLCKHGLVW